MGSGGVGIGEAEGKKARAGESPASTRAGALPAFIEGMTPKELGELAEAEFLRRALGMGMAITKPGARARLMTLSWTPRGGCAGCR